MSATGEQRTGSCGCVDGRGMEGREYNPTANGVLGSISVTARGEVLREGCFWDSFVHSKEIDVDCLYEALLPLPENDSV